MYSISTSDKQLYDEGFFSLAGIVKAYKSKDPRLAEYIIKLCIVDPAPDQKSSKEGVSPIDYKKFRTSYHEDVVNPNILRNIKVPDFGESKMPHQRVRQQKAQLFMQKQRKAIKKQQKMKVKEHNKKKKALKKKARAQSKKLEEAKKALEIEERKQE